MKKLILFIVVGVLVYFFIPNSDIDDLMVLPAVHKNNNGGLEDLDTSEDEKISIHDIASNGLLSIILYYEDGCPTCSQYLGYLNTMNQLRPDIAITSVKIPDNIYSNVLYRKYGVQFVRTISFVIVDAKGKIVAIDGGYDDDHNKIETAATLFWKWLHAENDRQRDPDVRAFRAEWSKLNS